MRFLFVALCTLGALACGEGLPLILDDPATVQLLPGTLRGKGEDGEGVLRSSLGLERVGPWWTWDELFELSDLALSVDGVEPKGVPQIPPASIPPV